MTKEANNMPITLEKARINLWNIIGFAAGIAVTAFGWGITYNSMTTADAAAVNDIAALTADVKALQALPYKLDRANEQITENKATTEAYNKATNDRIDRLVETFGGKIDLLTDSVNKLVTRVEVLSTRIGSTTAERTRFTMPQSPKL